MLELESKVEILENSVGGLEDKTKQLQERKEELCGLLEMMKLVAEGE